MRRVIGREGRMDQRASLGAAGGGWRSSVESLNALIDDLVRPTTEVASVLDAVADGDLDRKMALTIEGQPVKGEFLRIGTTVNTMVDQLSSFADEVTRVAREVGTEGKLGGQAEVKGVSGTWRDLTESVNGMASNLTDQVRNISHVAQAVARGDLQPEDHRGGQGRGRRAGRHDERDDRHARDLRRAGHERRARGGHRRQAGRPGRGAERVGNLEGPDRVGERHGVEPHEPGPQHRPGHDRRRRRRPHPAHHRGREGRDPRAEEHDQHHGRPAVLVRGRGHARGARGGHRGQARRPGRGADGGGHVEGPHRLGEPDGHQPHRPGARHRPGHDRRGRGRPVPEGHRGRAGRDRGAEGDREHHGRPAVVVRGRGHARGARGRHRGHPRRPGRGEGRVGHLARPDRVGELHGLEPDRPGAHRSRRCRPRWPTATCRRRSRSRPRARWPRSRTPSTRWWTGCARSRPRSRAWRARWAPRASWAARPRWRTSRARGAGSPRT